MISPLAHTSTFLLPPHHPSNTSSSPPTVYLFLISPIHTLFIIPHGEGRSTDLALVAPPSPLLMFYTLCK